MPGCCNHISAQGPPSHLVTQRVTSSVMVATHTALQDQGLEFDSSGGNCLAEGSPKPFLNSVQVMIDPRSRFLWAQWMPLVESPYSSISPPYPHPILLSSLPAHKCEF